MSRYLPSKKVFLVAVFAVGIFVWVIYAENAKDLRIALQKQPILSHFAFVNTDSDQDGDGLSDWKETLFDTDPHDPDSDGDGVSDGDEFVSKPAISNVTASGSVYESLTELGNELQNLPDPTESLSVKPVQYDDPFSIRNIRLVPADRATHEEYITDVFNILSQHTTGLEEEPLEIVKAWLETRSHEHLDKLAAISEENKNAALLLLDIHVPEDFAAIHLGVVNNLYKTGLSLDEIEKTTIDPTAGFFASANYANYQSKHIDHMFALMQTFTTTYDI